MLATHPGRHGDAIWALATVRAIAETLGEPVDFQISKKYGAIAALVSEQDYIGEVFEDATWEVVESAPISPRVPKHILGDFAVHLGYDGWPAGHNLPESIWAIAEAQVPGLKALELERPWIKMPTSATLPVVACFSDEYFELKVGVYELLRHEVPILALQGEGSRWQKESWFGCTCTFQQLAQFIAESKLFVGCLSAPWVLANALGKRTVIMEPSEPRWNSVFWLNSPRNTLVIGGDGRPTFDSRFVIDAVKKALEER